MYLARSIIAIILTLILYAVSFAEKVLIEAKQIQKISDNLVVAKGEVVIKYKDITIKSSKIKYYPKEENLEYNVLTEIISPKFYIKSNKGFYNLKKESGEFYNVSVILEKKYFIKAKKLTKNKDWIYFESAKFSNCPFNQYDWFVYSTSGKLRKNDYLHAKNVIFSFCKLPVFYTPYFLYPTSSRKTGFLPISVAQDSYNTFILKIPFFWAINESSDATFTFDYRDKQGKGLDLEYRKIFSQNTNFKLNTFYFKENEKASWWTGRPTGRLRERWLFKLNGYSEKIKNTKIFLNVNVPSDQYFYEDFYNTSPLRYTSYTKSQLITLTNTQDFSLETDFDFIYDLTTPTNENSLQRLPEVRFYWKERPLVKNLYYDFLSVNTNFYRDSGVRGFRSDNEFRLIMPLTYGYMYNFFELSPRATFYYLNNVDKNKYPSRNLIFLRDKVGFNIFKSYEKFTHSIIPYVQFSYISKVNQAKLPVFDKEDRINAKKDLDIYLNNILDFNNNDFFRWTVSTGYTFLQNYYIGDNKYKGHLKPLINSLFFGIKGFSGENTLYYDMKKRQINRSISRITIPLFNNLSYSISHSFDNNSTNQLLHSINTRYKIFRLNASILSNIKEGYIQQKRLNITIDRRCWYLSFNYIEDYNKTTNKTYKVLTLTLNIISFNYNFPLIKPEK